MDGSALAWLKVTDPDLPVPTDVDGVDLRLLLPEGDGRFTALAEKLTGAGAQVRWVRYLVEDEAVTAPAGAGPDQRPTAECRPCRLVRMSRSGPTTVTGAAAEAARDAFDILWQDHTPLAGPVRPQVGPEQLVPPELAAYLPFQTFNPAQAQALPHVFGDDRNLVVVAPTGAGKTVIGMAAALRTVVQQRRKAAWLVPQRSLTDELDRELDHWRARGLRVQRLSGEHTVDIDRIRDADLWVATTEKFEAICRASAFRAALAEVGALIVDEIHMLGDPMRGPVLETLLARVREITVDPA